MLLNVLGLAGALLAFAPAAVEQFDQLVQEVPAAVEDLRARLEEYAWGEELLRRATPGALISDGSGGRAATAVATTFGALGNFVIMVFIGLYVALDPQTYRRGLVSVLAPSVRAESDEVAQGNRHAEKLACCAAVGHGRRGIADVAWLVAHWRAARTHSRPDRGAPRLHPQYRPDHCCGAGRPSGFLRWPDDGFDGRRGVYLGVQTVESCAITPLIQQERVSLPPTLIISMQLLMGVLFGVLGLALASPMAALGLTLVREAYVQRYLGQEARDDGARADPAPSA